MKIDESLQACVGGLLQAKGVPGCSIALWRDGQRAAAHFGHADVVRRRPVGPATVFHLFSGTKLYTAAAVMVLRERGWVELDAPIGEYLDDLELGHPVSLRQLLSHSSGLPDTLAGFFAVHFEGTPMPSTAAALARYRTRSGKQPGRKAAYRNVNYAILGELISRVSKVPYVDFIDSELLTPLASEATFDYRDDQRGQAAVGTIPRFNPMRWLLRFLRPAAARQLARRRDGSVVSLNDYALDTAAIGGLLGCAEDFLPMVAELLNPRDGVLTGASKREMLTLHSRGQAGIVSRVGVGLGWKLGRHQGVEFWNHEGGGAGFCSETRIYPQDDFGVVVLMNATQSRRLSMLAHDICELLRLHAC